MNSFEELVRSHDSSLHTLVRLLVPFMPDFRPQETVQRMKRVTIDGRDSPEPQDNWQVLYNDLSSISHNSLHLELLEALNEEKMDTIYWFMEEDRIVKEFFFSYPALTWLLMKTNAAIIPLCVSEGEYIEDLSGYLQDIQYIGFIRNIEVAQKIHKISTVTRHSVLDSIESNPLHRGFFYWLIADNFNFFSFDHGLPYPYQVSRAIANTYDMNLIRLIFPPRKEKIDIGIGSDKSTYDKFVYGVIHDMVRIGFEEGLRYLLSLFSLNPQNQEDLLWSAGEEENLDIFLALWNMFDPRIEPIESLLTLKPMMAATNACLMKKILLHPRLENKAFINKQYILNLMRYTGGNKAFSDVLQVILEYGPSLSDEAGELLGKVAMRGRGELAKILIENGFPIKDMHIKEAIKNNNQEVLQVFLEAQPSLFLPSMEDLLRMAISRQLIGIIKILLDIPSIERKVKSTLLIQARNMVSK